jgi:predicted amidohydrolase
MSDHAVGAFPVAVAQFAPGADAAANLAEIERLAELAAARGARLVVFPEYSSYVTPEPGWDWQAAAEEVGGRFTEQLGAIATRLGVHLVAGMIERLGGDERRVGNTVVAVAPRDGVVARYR